LAKWGIRSTNVQISTNVDRSTKVQFSTNAPILPNPCCVLFFYFMIKFTIPNNVIPPIKNGRKNTLKLIIDQVIELFSDLLKLLTFVLISEIVKLLNSVFVIPLVKAFRIVKPF